MSRRRYGPIRLLGLLLVCTLLGAESIATPQLTVPPLDPEHAELARVLARVVHAEGVDYAELRRDHVALDRYRVQLAQAALPAEREARLAFFINAYNALTLALVVERLPQDQAAWDDWSIRSLGGWFTSVWKAYDFDVAGRRVTLHAIEHEILRPLDEPRIHFAINCASRSCPPLRAEPYLAERLEAQLEAAATAFARDPAQLRLEDDVLRVNPILDWFAEDFAQAGGVREFLRQRVPAGPVADALAGEQRLRFFAYDWRLNHHRP